MKRRAGLIGILIGLLIVAPALAQGGGDGSVLPDPRQMQRVEASVDKALQYLAKHQKPDGSWPSKWGDNNGINAFCLLAMLGRGHLPGRGPYKDTINRAIAHLLATQRDDGFFKSPDTSHGPMYEHALATLAMIEAYGFRPTKRMRQSVQNAVDLIVKSQSPSGGWRYQPVPKNQDLSVTVMQIVALRAAQNARLHVPEKTMQNAQKYVEACHKKGGFAYRRGRGPSMAQTAAGVLSMHLLGAFDSPKVKKALQWLAKRKNKYGKNVGHFWYMNYYAMQAHFQAGGSHWANWHPQVRKLLLDSQKADGSWPGFNRGSKYQKQARTYTTALGAMSLEVYMHYLPAYQR